MRAADVVEVAVADHRQGVVRQDLGQVLQERGDAQSGVDDHVMLLATDPPEVRRDEAIDVRLGQPGHALADVLDAEPLVRDRQSLSTHRSTGTGSLLGARSGNGAAGNRSRRGLRHSFPRSKSTWSGSRVWKPAEGVKVSSPTYG